MTTEQPTATVRFVATPEGVNLEVENGTEGRRVKLSLASAVTLLRALREETTEAKRLAKRAERKAAKGVTP
jgi:hypothetical protein